MSKKQSSSSMDSETKALFQDNVRFADLFNAFVFGGEQVIDPAQLQEKDTTGIASILDGVEISRTIQRSRDVFKCAVMKSDGQVDYLLLGIENQAQVDYGMVPRLMLYDAIGYYEQMARCDKLHREKKEKRSESFTSMLLKEDTLHPILTLVVYWGEQPWDAPMTMYDLLRPLPEGIKRYIPNYHMNLITPRELTPQQLDELKSDLRAVFGFIRYSDDLQRLELFIQENQGQFESMDPRAVSTIKTVTGANLLTGEERNGEINMCQAIQDMISRSEAMGIAKGMAEGEAKGMAKGIAKGRQLGAVETIVAFCREDGGSMNDAVAAVVQRLKLSQKDSNELVRQFWTN